MGGKKKNMEIRVSPNTFSVTGGSGAQSQGEKEGLGLTGKGEDP